MALSARTKMENFIVSIHSEIMFYDRPSQVFNPIKIVGPGDLTVITIFSFFLLFPFLFPFSPFPFSLLFSLKFVVFGEILTYCGSGYLGFPKHTLRVPQVSEVLRGYSTASIRSTRVHSTRVHQLTQISHHAVSSYDNTCGGLSNFFGEQTIIQVVSTELNAKETCVSL